MLGDFGVSGLAIYPSSWFRVPYCDFRVCGLYGILIGHLGSDLRVRGFKLQRLLFRPKTSAKIPVHYSYWYLFRLLNIKSLSQLENLTGVSEHQGRPRCLENPSPSLLAPELCPNPKP